MKKAAIVIGVDRTGGLTPLSSAAAGAARVADWLKGEGFDVKLLTDADQKAVTSNAVQDAIEAFVTAPPRYHQLLVYFSGHGLWQARSDIWLLSGAPKRASEAVNLRAAVDLARYSGIPNVVFVSDACRSLPQQRSGAMVEGVGAFPSYADIVSASKVDLFLATSAALPAYEGQLEGEPQSVLTAALMSAFQTPDAPMVRQVVDRGEMIEVVPNRQLESYLQRKVEALLQRIDRNATQQIVVEVPSAEDVYIARVRRGAEPSEQPPDSGADFGDFLTKDFGIASPGDPGRAAARVLGRSLSARASRGYVGDVLAAPQEAPLEAGMQLRMPDPRHDHFETQSGFIVNGAALWRVAATQKEPRLDVELLTPGDGVSDPGLVRLNWGGGSTPPMGTIALQFADRRCVLLAGLPGFIGHVGVDAAGVSNVSYIPSANHPRYADYATRKAELDRLRAMVAVALDGQRFQLRSDGEAQALAGRIRVLKSIDPTLGAYAAHAFTQAGHLDQVRDVLEWMRNDLGGDLYDVRLLASRRPDPAWAGIPLAPICPMLTQSWNLLRARGVELPALLHDMGNALCDSLWTTFEPDAGVALIDALTRGEL